MVEPGVTRTSFEENLTRADRPLAACAEDRARSEGLMRKWVEAGDDPQLVGRGGSLTTWESRQGGGGPPDP